MAHWVTRGEQEAVIYLAPMQPAALLESFEHKSSHDDPPLGVQPLVFADL